MSQQPGPDPYDLIPPGLCHDSRTPAVGTLPPELDHPALPDEARCEYHGKQFGRWEQREKRAKNRLAADPDGPHRGPADYRPTSRPSRELGVELTRKQARQVLLAVANLLYARALLGGKPARGAGPSADADLRALLKAADVLAAALLPVRRWHRR